MREQFAHLGSDVVGRYLRDKSPSASEESIMDALSRLGSGGQKAHNAS